MWFLEHLLWNMWLRASFVEHVALEHLLRNMWLRASLWNMWLRASFVEHVLHNCQKTLETLKRGHLANIWIITNETMVENGGPGMGLSLTDTFDWHGSLLIFDCHWHGSLIDTGHWLILVILILWFSVGNYLPTTKMLKCELLKYWNLQNLPRFSKQLRYLVMFWYFIRSSYLR